MNVFTAVCNLTKDPEDINLGGNDLVKLRLADNTYGAKSETRFFDALFGGKDKDVVAQLKTGDEICVTGTLTKGSYKSKQGKNKGRQVEFDSMPFAKLIRVTKSPTFFAGSEDEDTEAADSASNEEPDIGTGDAAGGDDPLADVL